MADHLPSGSNSLQIQTHPVDQLATAGMSVNFTCVATGDPNITYQWFYNNVPIPQATNTSLTFIANFSNFGSYHCNATSTGTNKEVASNSATLTGKSYVIYCTVLVFTHIDMYIR